MIRRLLAYPLDIPTANIRNVGDLLAASACYGISAFFAVVFTAPAWSV